MVNSGRVELCCGERVLDLSSPQVMGVLNVTPDSFSDGGLFLSVENALLAADEMVSEGASIVDVGGESTRPGAASVSPQQELDRVMPVVERIKNNLDVIISLDTSSPLLIREAGRLGVGLINDVRALTVEDALSSACTSGLPVCLMHMQGAPSTMQGKPQYIDVVEEVFGFLDERITACLSEGITKDKLLVDPGFGFGKSLDHNLRLLGGLSRLDSLGCPILVGVSRKSMIGELVGKPVDGRLIGSVAAALIAVERGADIVRVHDVGATVDALKVYGAVRELGA
ncbi:MAG: dihydropteroate synthase [Gammaproteobacteria bacterium]|nr:MAG: dihydropteroate synthase [Gammaproteobacteria bacterium]